MKQRKIEYRKTEDLIPYINNPRINDDAVDKVAASIAEFGFNVPIVIDKNNIIVTGHTRYKAAQKLKIKEVPTIQVDDLTEAQVKAVRIADNKVGELAEWDNDLLKIEFDELKELNFDLELTGFELDDIGDIFENDKQQQVTEDDYNEELPIGLFDYQICNNTKSDDIVLDLFDGSGTTIMACEQNGRKAYCMELDPRYVDAAIDWWEKFTGKKAILLNPNEAHNKKDE